MSTVVFVKSTFFAKSWSNFQKLLCKFVRNVDKQRSFDLDNKATDVLQKIDRVQSQADIEKVKTNKLDSCAIIRQAL